MSGEPRKWSTIYAPVELKEKVKQLSDKTRKAQWKVLLDAVALYEATIRKPKTKAELPIVDKVLWYIEKLCMSIGALKENPTGSNLQKSLKTIKQIKERLGIDTALLEKAAADYHKATAASYKDEWEKHYSLDEATTELNMALKSVLLEMAYKHILKEEVPTQSGSQASEA